MTFWQWLRQQKKRNDRIGDLARDAVVDSTFPRRARRRETLKIYLESCNACAGAIEALDAAFQQFRVDTQEAQR